MNVEGIYWRDIMEKNKYRLYRKFINGSVRGKLDGYKFKPRNKVNSGALTVSSITITNRALIQDILKKKIKKKLDLYLQFLISVLDDEDSDPGHLMFALNDLERYKTTIKNNYRKYLDSKYNKLLMNKIELLEQELRSKIKIDIKDFVSEQIQIDFEEPIKGRKR